MQTKHTLFLGLAFGVLGPSLEVRAEEILRYQDTSGYFSTVGLIRGEKSWTLTITSSRGNWQNSALFPVRHPIDESLASAIDLEPKLGGFTVHATYSVLNLIEKIQITFKDSLENPAIGCPLQISGFRREQRYAPGEEKQGQLRSGLEADFSSGVARIFMIEGQPKDTPSVPVGMLDQERSFCKLPSVFEFTPLLDIPKVR